MNGIKNIIFDLGGVLLNLDMLKAEESFVKMGAPAFRELFGKGNVKSFIRDYEIGVINDEQFTEDLMKLTGNKYTRDEVLAGWNAMLLDFPADRFTFLEKLKTKYRLFLFSNTNAIHVTFFLKKFAQEFGGRSLESYFEKVYYSNVINLRKPEIAAFEYVVKDSHLNPAETLFVDDMLVNIEGARAAGLQGMHLEPGKTILDLGLWNETVSA